MSILCSPLTCCRGSSRTNLDIHGGPTGSGRGRETPICRWTFACVNIEFCPVIGHYFPCKPMGQELSNCMQDGHDFGAPTFFFVPYTQSSLVLSLLKACTAQKLASVYEFLVAQRSCHLLFPLFRKRLPPAVDQPTSSFQWIIRDSVPCSIQALFVVACLRM